MKYRLSQTALGLVALVWLVALHCYQPWQDGILRGGDSWGYYMYLPSGLIHHDLAYPAPSLRLRHGLLGLETTGDPVSREDMLLSVGEGRVVNRYTMGVAILLSPFWGAGHLITLMTGSPADGYSFWYRYLVHLGGWVYAALGLWMLMQVLVRQVSDTAAALTLLLTGLATNLMYFAVIQPVMAHAPLFGLWAGLILATVRFWEKPSWTLAVGIGVTAGMITLIRPSELICLLIPVSWGLDSWRTLGGRLRQAGAWMPQASLAAAVFVLTLIPQLLYWKAVTGYWVYYSYGGVKFDFAHPHVVEGLFSFKNGWLVYTPIMSLSLIGIAYLRRWQEALLPVVLLLPIHIYIVYAWPYWNYLNGLGSRPMVEVYPLLGIPLALVLHAWLGAGWWRLLLVPVSVAVIWINQLQTWQTWAGVYFPEDNHRAYYLRMLTRIRPRYEDLVLFDALEVQPDTSQLTRVRQLYADPIADTLRYGRHVVVEPVHSPPYAVYSTEQLPYGPGVNLQADTAGIHPRDWVQAAVWAYRPYTGQDLYRMSYLVVTVEGGGQARVWRAVRLDNKPGNDLHTLWGGSARVWGRVSLLVRMPDDLAPTDIVKVYVWHPGNRPLYVDDLTVASWRE